jgi:hypothetical protein
MADSPVKKHYDYAQQVVDEQAILDKYNAATTAQFNVQREQNRQAENQFYNQMYNTQKTAMDTIRQSNAAAVANGASRGVQAANELSALLGLQQESVQSATEIAQANRQTAQEETAAVLENVLKAYQQAQQERSQLVTQSIEAQSLEATESQAKTAADSLTAQRDQQYFERLDAGDVAGAAQAYAAGHPDIKIGEAPLTAEAINTGTAFIATTLEKVQQQYAGKLGSTEANEAIGIAIADIANALGMPKEYTDTVMNQNDMAALFRKPAILGPLARGTQNYNTQMLGYVIDKLKQDYTSLANKQ